MHSLACVFKKTQQKNDLFSRSYRYAEESLADANGRPPQERMTAVQLINVQRLLEAADYLERRERGNYTFTCVLRLRRVSTYEPLTA